MAPDNTRRVAESVAERGMFSVPCPLVSRARPVFRAPASVAVNVQVGPARVLAKWSMGAAPGAEPAPPPPPMVYRLETSANSRDGLDGDWRVELVIDGNVSSSRAHVIEFDGQTWVRLVVPELEAGASGVALGLQLDVHDASDGTDDSWLILGDGFGVWGLGALEGAAGFAELVHEQYPGYHPALINEARAGERATGTLARLELLLAVHAHARHVALVYADVEPAALEALVVALLEAKRLPSLVCLGSRRDIVALEARHGLVPGPDLGVWFEAHPDQLDAGSRPTPEGRQAIHRLWAEAMDAFYVPQ